MAQRTIMHVDLDAFFVSVEVVLNPELKGKPVVVGGRPDARGVISAASYEARAFGLHSAMPLKTASRLCPQAIFIEGNFQRYREASKKFMAILADFSPFIEPMGLDEAYLDVTGFESLHGTIRGMAVSIKQRVMNEQGLCASIGIAPCKVVAKVASDYSKPDGLVEVKPGKERDFFAPLPVGRLPGIGKQAQKRLKELGVTTIGQLASMPLKTLNSHFGITGTTMLNAANGIDNRKVELPGTAKSISRETTFREDTNNSEFLKSTLRYLGEKVGADLRRREKRAKCVTLKIRYSDFTTSTRSQTVQQPFDSNEIIFSTGVRLLEKAMQIEKQPVRLLGIGVSGIVEPGGQMSMLDNEMQRLAKLTNTIDGIRDKFGFSAIQTGRTLLLRDIFAVNGK
ncbi:MAG: DNA polymerase IV [Chloroflexi bacterium RBG_13_46_14]|nr:MAG: DNA polymerase IV [Chloroflexi bacterium RBG_13_46_14]